MPDIFETFKALAAKARQTKDKGDIRVALAFGINNRISTAKIRKYLSGRKP